MPGCTIITPGTCDGTAAPCSAFDGDTAACPTQWGCGPGASGACSDTDVECDDATNDEQFCRSMPGCEWTGLYCFGDVVRSCSNRTNRTSCEGSGACLWTYAAGIFCCGTALTCAVMDTDVCELQAGCSVTPATCSGTPQPCEELDAEQCLRQPGCRRADGTTRTITPTARSVTRADLAFETFSLARARLSGVDYIGLEFSEINRGMLASGFHRTKLVLSADEVYDGEDYVLREMLTDFALLPYGIDHAGLSTYLSTPEASDIAPGWYYPIGVLDAYSNVTESEEANNIQVLPRIYVGPAVYDLAVDGVSHAVEGTMAPGDALTLTVTVTNQSTETVSEAAVEVYLSSDEVLSDDDVLVTCPTSLQLDMAPGGQGDFALACAAPRARGAYHLVVALDPDDVWGDLDRADNTAVAGGPVTVSAPSPDLQVTDVSSSSDLIRWREDVTLSATIENTGIDPSPATTVSFAIGGEHVCSTSVGSLAASATSTVTASCTPSANLHGSFPITARVDPSDLVYEISENNNFGSSGVNLTIADPDVNLIALSITISAGSSPGTFKFDYVIQNSGSDEALPFGGVIYASLDTAISPSDNQVCTFGVNGLPAFGDTTGSSISCTLPTLPAGTYYFGMIVDTEHEVYETNESDNTDVDGWNTITVRP